MKESIVIFSSNWGARYGGVDSFNYDLCVALASTIDDYDFSLRIICVLSEEDSTEEEIETANSLGIECYSLPGNVDTQIIIAFLEEKNINPIYVLGHDVHTGQRAIDLATSYGIKLAIFHHMNYRAYRSDQAAIRKQERIIRVADIIFAVGPTLVDSAKSIINGFKKDEDCIKEIQPGISLRQNLADKPPPNFSAITLGRVNLENDLVKQIKLAAASFGRAVFEEPYTIRNKQPSLTIVGISIEDLATGQASLQKLAQKYADRHVSICAWPYEKDRKALFDELTNKTVCMVLSSYEGFSLVGLEAISVGVPLILSENTGLYKAIDLYLGGSGTGCLYPVDISANEDIENDLKCVVEQLRKIASEPDKAKGNAIALRESLRELWTWENTATQVLSQIRNEVRSKSDNIFDISTYNTGLPNVPISEVRDNLASIEESGSQRELSISLPAMKPKNVHRSVIIDIYQTRENFNLAILDFNDSLGNERIHNIPVIPSDKEVLEHPLVNKVLKHIYHKGKYSIFIDWLRNEYPGSSNELT